MNSFKDKLDVVTSECDRASALPSNATIVMAERAMGMTFGPLLREYLSSFGYLGRGDIELYGINERQGLNSDMVRTTLNLLEFAPGCRGYAVIDNRGDGDYILCDSGDQIFAMPNSPTENPIPLGICLDAYIVSRLKG